MIQRFSFACFALIRRWRDTFPTRGKASVGDPYNEDVTPIPGNRVTHTTTPLIEVF